MYKIYKIVDNTNGNVYIGLTTQKLKRRIGKHKSDYKANRYYSSSLILCNNDWCYEIIEETDDKSREAYWIKNTPNCINEIKFTYDEKEYSRKYRLDNKTKLNEKKKQYHFDNKTKINEGRKQYRLDNKTLINEKAKEVCFMNKFGNVMCDWLLMIESY